MDVELSWLRTWIEVVDSGGFARAAARMHLSQPRVSARVASLERALDCVLIERRMRPLTLTDDGQRLLPRARLIVTAMDDTVSDMRSTAGSFTGKLAVASFASASSEFLPDLLMQLRTANPLLEIAVLDGDVQVIDDWLSDRRAAVALRPLRPEPADHALIHRGIWREPFVVLAPPGHPVLDHDSIGLDDVAAHPVITIGDPLGDPSLGYEAWSAMQASRIVPAAGIVSHQPTTLAAMVRAGHGIGLVNSLAAAMVRTDGLEVREVSSHHLYRDVGLWWHAERPLSRATQAFVDLVLAADRPAGTLPIPD
ncbi:LysR family transcriptional regulator [Kribbella sp. NPDC058693]|uniref:LysR family transcriptional regulator n=1 Tax=Kribbella jiaozuonensis TaxID=2575441 RepID=A0A4U3LKQ1_9ACTN|nr:LysR family transcriptional regulator [Kribbella jiaozuonensis]TKK76305.1 LysR family transcriptional regulator [Kribbella jiaozuonensis]